MTGSIDGALKVLTAKRAYYAEMNEDSAKSIARWMESITTEQTAVALRNKDIAEIDIAMNVLRGGRA
jgi:hypothetical protein